MWDLVIHLMVGMVLGWYLFPFREGNTFRSKVNSILMGLAQSILAMMNKEGTPVKATQGASGRTSQARAQNTDSRPYGNKLCTACKEGMLEPIKEGTYKGFWFCPKCKTMEASK